MRALLMAALVLTCAAQADDYVQARIRLVAEVERYALLAGDAVRGGLDAEVVAALRKVERHQFVPERELPFAYENRPLPIGYGQTISQPYIVALMTDLIQSARCSPSRSSNPFTKRPVRGSIGSAMTT